MELTFYTDYSLRVLIYLAIRPGRRCEISEVAAAYGISQNHLTKVVHGLSRGGFVRSYRGRGGGINLARDPAKINVGAVVRYTEGPFKPVECFRGSNNRCVITAACGLVPIIKEACENFLATLDRYTLADLVGNQRRLLRMLETARTPSPSRPPSGRTPTPAAN